MFVRLPELQGELDRLLEQTDHDISRLPNPPSEEPMAEILKLIGLFVRSVDQVIAGSPDENGLMQALREPREGFKKKIRQTAPDFRPLERPNQALVTPAPPEPSFLSSEEQESDWQLANSTQPIWVEDVMKKANS